MTALWIIGGIILLIALLMMVSVTVYVKIDETVSVKAGALGIRFSLFPAAEKADKPHKKQPPKEKKSASGEKKPQPQKKANDRSFGETVDFAVAILRSVVPGAVGLVRKIRFTRMRIFLSVGADSADDTAVRYGQLCTAVYSLLACIDKAMTLRVKDVSIVPDFVTGETRYDISFCAKLRIGSAVASALGVLFKLISIFMKQEKTKPAAKPSQTANVRSAPQKTDGKPTRKD